jgi:alpha-ketoglutarate-dependent taurine dioxygenase
MQKFLDGIKVKHSSANMINHTRLAGGLVRKDPVTTIHPLIRVHPITGARCIFINGEFITGAVGLKDVEWKTISDFLLQHLIGSHDLQARVHWSPRTIVMFDNRSTIRESPHFMLRLAYGWIEQIRRLLTTLTMNMGRNLATFSVWLRWLRNLFLYLTPERCIFSKSTNI